MDAVEGNRKKSCWNIYTRNGSGCLKLLQAASKGGSYYKHGREVSVGQELLSNLLGTKIITTDVDSRFERNLTKWNFARQEAVQEFKSMIKSETSFSRRELQRALEKAIEMDKIVVSNAYRDYLAIKDLSPSRANKLLRVLIYPRILKVWLHLGCINHGHLPQGI